MKTAFLKYIALASIVLFITSCLPKSTFEDIGGTIVTCKFSNMKIEGETPEFIKQTLMQRIGLIDGSVNVEVSYNEGDSSFVVKVPGVEENLVDILLSHGEVSICETVSTGRPMTANKRTMLVGGDGLDSLLQLYYDMRYLSADCQLLLGVEEEDKNDVKALVERLNIRVLPSTEVEYLWGRVGEDAPTKYNLFVIAKSEANINVKEKLKRCSITQSSNNHLAISILLGGENAEKFEKLTSNNIGRPLAIVYDDAVLLAPFVNSRIEGGRMEISGLPNKETRLLEILLNSNTIKSKVEIINKTVVNRKKI